MNSLCLGNPCDFSSFICIQLNLVKKLFGIILTWTLLISINLHVRLSLDNGWNYWAIVIEIPITIAMILWCVIRKKEND